jgi:diacylglycerol kinase
MIGKIVVSCTTNNFFTIEKMMEINEIESNLEMDVPIGLYYGVYVQIVENSLIGIAVLIVAVCSVITIRALNSSTVESIGPGDRSDSSNNRRATVMVLLLSFVFVVINGAWIIIICASQRNILINLSRENNPLKAVIESFDKSAPANFITIVMMPGNSIINPLIYITRNSLLHEYTKMLLKKSLREAWKSLQKIGSVALGIMKTSL